MDTDKDYKNTRTEAVTKVAQLMKGIRTCMLSTLRDGKIVSRPMAVQQVEFDGDLWFFTHANSTKVDDIAANPNVNVAFDSSGSWVSLSGVADLVSDRQKIKELWNPLLKAWFPEGEDDPNITLLRVKAVSAEYWEAGSGRLVSLFGTVKAAVTGKPAEGGDNETVDLL